MMRRVAGALAAALSVVFIAAPSHAVVRQAGDPSSDAACLALDADRASMKTAAKLLDRSAAPGAQAVAEDLRRASKRSAGQRGKGVGIATLWCTLTTSSTTATPRVTSPPTTAAPQGFAGSGTYSVGTTPPPGLYVSMGNTSCYWERARDASGSLDSIIENDNARGQALVQLNPGEIFKTSRCSRWTLYAPPAQPLTTFGDGTWGVPGQVTPGRWQSTGGSSCYWQRSVNFDGSIDSIAANDNVEGPTIVDIQPSDVAFVSQQCGTWTKVG
jgi:hypothetical protein